MSVDEAQIRVQLHTVLAFFRGLIPLDLSILLETLEVTMLQDVLDFRFPDFALALVVKDIEDKFEFAVEVCNEYFRGVVHEFVLGEQIVVVLVKQLEKTHRDNLRQPSVVHPLAFLHPMGVPSASHFDIRVDILQERTDNLLRKSLFLIRIKCLEKNLVCLTLNHLVSFANLLIIN